MSDAPRPRPVSVLVVDDHPVFRDTLANAVRDDERTRLTGTAADDRTALVSAREDPPDVALVDVHLPTGGGLQLVSTIGQAGLPTRCLMVSGEPDGATVVEAISRGAHGFLTKGAHAAEIIEAVLAVADGGSRFDAAAQDLLAGRIRSRPVTETPQVLTDRERLFLQETAQGLSTQSIADRHSYAAATVRSDLSAIYRKLGVRDRAAAVAEAYRRGIID